jgi:hypothetical protein
MPRICTQCRRKVVKGRLFVIEEGKVVQLSLCPEHRKQRLTGRNDNATPNLANTHDTPAPSSERRRKDKRSL